MSLLHEFSRLNGMLMHRWDWSPEKCNSSLIGHRQEGHRDDRIFYKSRWQVGTVSLSICGKWNRAVCDNIVTDELHIDLSCKLLHNLITIKYRGLVIWLTYYLSILVYYLVSLNVDLLICPQSWFICGSETYILHQWS